MKKLDFAETLKDSIEIGVKNAPSIVVAVILWLVTIWIPYINIGTTIAIKLLPVELAKGNVINPLSIFDSKYRRYMGEFLITWGLMLIPIYIATLFLVVPGIVLSLSWTLSFYFLLDKGITRLKPSRRRTTRHTAASGQCFSSYWYSASSWVSCTGFSCSSARPSTSRSLPSS